QSACVCVPGWARWREPQVCLHFRKKMPRALDCDWYHTHNSIYDGNHLVVVRRLAKPVALPKTQMCCSCVVIRGRIFYAPAVPLRFCGCGTKARGILTPRLAHAQCQFRGLGSAEANPMRARCTR